MPEAIPSKPSGCVQTGNSSGTDTGSNTARSFDDARPSAETPRSTGALRKMVQPKSNAFVNRRNRKSKGGRSLKKPLKINSPQHKTSPGLTPFYKRNSKITRPQLRSPSPSSSTTSLSALSTTTRSTQPATPRPSGLPRQYSSHRLNFRLRKSISQMEFKHTRIANFAHLRAPGNLQKPERDLSEVVRITNMCDIVKTHKQALLVKNKGDARVVPAKSGTTTLKTGLRGGGLVVTQSHTAVVHKLFHQNEYYYEMEDRGGPKMARLRIFDTMMLNAYRKRRDDVKRLTIEVADLTRGAIRVKNQLHVFNTLFRVEQKRNDELSIQLKQSIENVNQAKSSCELLADSLFNMENNKVLLEEQLQIKDQEFEGVNTILSQTKSELFKAMAQQRELQTNMSIQQRKLQDLENQKEDLLTEITDLTEESQKKKEDLQELLKKKEEELAMATEENKTLKDLLVQMEEYERKIADFDEVELKYKTDIEELKSEVDSLKNSLVGTLVCRAKTCWQQSAAYQKTTLQIIHWFAYCILPAAPPPKISSFPFTLTLQKALSIVKR